MAANAKRRSSYELGDGMRIATKGPKEGVCNICGTFSVLTNDHSPPQGWVAATRVEIRSLAQRLGAKDIGRRPRQSQSGVKYRTLCENCNSGLLGAKYDPALVQFANDVARMLTTKIELPSQFELETRPQAVVRSVLGHIAAQGVGRYRKGPGTEELRDFILDETAPLPQRLRVFYWPYPYRSQVLVRDAAYVDLRLGKEPFLVWFLKVFPLAFMISWDGPKRLPVRCNSFDRWRSLGAREVARVPVWVRPVVPEMYPEAPTDSSALMFGQEAINAVPM